MSLPVVIQTRMSSERLPGKVMLKYKGFTMIDLMLQRLKKSHKISKIIIATTINKKDLPIVNFCKKKKINFFRGSEENVLERYYETANYFKLKNIVRLTSDCPLVDTKILDYMINFFEKNQLDFYSNSDPLPCKFPDGIFIEIFNYKTLKKTYLEAKLPSEREHVSFYMWKSGKFKTKRYDIKEDYSKYRFTLDYKEDFKLICSLIDFFGKSITSVNMCNIIDFIKKNPQEIIYQKNIYRTIGYKRAFQRDKKFTNG